MSWRETWRETVESFLRELHGLEADTGPVEDPLVRAIAASRAAAGSIEREIVRTRERLDEESAAVEMCARRRELAERIRDVDTAAVAGRFERRHLERAELLRRRSEVLRDELALARRELGELLELARAEASNEGAGGTSEAPAP